MGFLVGLIVTVVGFILALAVHRRTYVDQGPGYGPGYGATPSRWGYPRRRVIEEEEAGGPRGPGPGY